MHDPNLPLLSAIAEALGELNERVVYVGASAGIAVVGDISLPANIRFISIKT